MTSPTSEDALRKYLEEIHGQPLLAFEASPDERAKLETFVQEGRKAKESLVRSNLRLVVSIAKGYSTSAQPLLNLIQQGNLGLIRAVDSFEPTSQTRFSAHAEPFIRRAIEFDS